MELNNLFPVNLIKEEWLKLNKEERLSMYISYYDDMDIKDDCGGIIFNAFSIVIINAIMIKSIEDNKNENKK